MYMHQKVQSEWLSGISKRIQRYQTLGPYQQKSCSSLTHFVLLRRYVLVKMAQSESGPYLYSVTDLCIRNMSKAHMI